MAVAADTDRPATACAWCGAPLGGDARRARGRALCPRCGAATTDPWPSDETLARAYSGWYRPHGGRFAGAGDAFLRRSRGALARRIDAIAPPGRVLDVGAGDGALIDALRRRGREAVGLERESERDDMLALELAELEEGGWAAIVLWHSLEHLRAPGEAIERAAELLAPGGVLIVAVPNSASIQARLFGDSWFALDIPRHLVHLPAPSLVAGIERTGLRVRRVSHLRGGQVVFGWLHGLVGRLPGRPDLYDAIRRPQARRAAMPPARRAAALAAATLLVPLALAGAAAEAALRRGGSVYVEAVHD